MKPVLALPRLALGAALLAAISIPIWAINRSRTLDADVRLYEKLGNRFSVERHGGIPNSGYIYTVHDRKTDREFLVLTGIRGPIVEIR